MSRVNRSRCASALQDGRSKGVVDEVEAEARAQRVAAKLVDWYNDHVGPSLLEYARVGTGRRIHIVDTTHVEVPLETGTYECSGVVKNDDGSAIKWVQIGHFADLIGRCRTDHAGGPVPDSSA